MTKTDTRILDLRRIGRSWPAISEETGLSLGQARYLFAKAVGGAQFMAQEAARKCATHEPKRRRRSSVQKAQDETDRTVDLMSRALALHESVYVEAGLNDGYIATVGNTTGVERRTIVLAITDAMQRARR